MEVIDTLAPIKDTDLVVGSKWTHRRKGDESYSTRRGIYTIKWIEDNTISYGSPIFGERTTVKREFVGAKCPYNEEWDTFILLKQHLCLAALDPTILDKFKVLLLELKI